jgi:hypothetical protein
MTKKRSASIFIFFLLFICILISCNQDAIFAIISREEPPITPRINGSSTNLVRYGNSLYAASIGSDTIHSYKDGNWGTIDTPGVIIGLAATSTHLYALVAHDINRQNNSLHAYNGGWTEVSGGSGSLQSIWGANNTIFVGARNGNSWNIYSAIGTGTLTSRISNSGQLNGAAYDGTDYYIATSNGIYVGPGTFPETVKDGSAGNVTGIMDVNGVITAVTGGGRILTYSASEFGSISDRNDLVYTGAMCTWKQNGTGTDKLLLLGTKNGGYIELALDTGGKPTSSLARPGGSPSSLSDVYRYEQTIAKHPVYHIIQVPIEVSNSNMSGDGQPLIFASTFKDGVWRLRDGRWNAEG